MVEATLGFTSRYQAVAEAAQALVGDEWHRALARVLGPYHPEGPREEIDVRMVRRWAAGDRPIPSWVGDTLIKLLRREASAMVTAAASLERSLQTPAIKKLDDSIQPIIALQARKLEAGHIVGRYVSQATLKALNDLFKSAGDGTGRAFKGEAVNAAHAVSRQVMIDLRQRAVGPFEIAKVSSVFASFGKTTTGQDLGPFAQGVREGTLQPA